MLKNLTHPSKFPAKLNKYINSSQNVTSILSGMVEGITVKMLSATKWNEEYNAVKSVTKHFYKVVQVVEKLYEPTENGGTKKCTAQIVTKKT